MPLKGNRVAAAAATVTGAALPPDFIGELASESRRSRANHIHCVGDRHGGAFTLHCHDGREPLAQTLGSVPCRVELSGRSAEFGAAEFISA